ncbi:MAG: hypothetical protein ACLVHS_12965 [Blautia wexlerae]
MTEKFESEVQDMCNLGKALVEQGIEQGIVKGIEQGMEQGIEQKNLSLAKMMLKDKEPIDKIKNIPVLPQISWKRLQNLWE